MGVQTKVRSYALAFGRHIKTMDGWPEPSR